MSRALGSGNGVTETPVAATGDESFRMWQRPDMASGHSQASSVAAIDVLPSGALPSAGTPKGVRQPKWRLCFRSDQQLGSLVEGQTVQKHQRDFCVSIIDPPVRSATRPPPPFFASEMACQIANLVVRLFLEHLPGRSFEGKTIAALGKDCLIAGLVAGMLGAKVALVCERHLLHHVQQNVRSYLRDTLDYTKTKRKCVTAVACSPGRTGCLVGSVLCDQLSAAPSLDVAVLTESTIVSMTGNAINLIGDTLKQLAPVGAPTKILLICDGIQDSVAYGNRDTSPACEEDDDLSVKLVLPPEWQLKRLCYVSRFSQRFPAVWLERQDASYSRSHVSRSSVSLRSWLPAMSVPASRRCADSHQQQSCPDHHLLSCEGAPESVRARLKEALTLHNKWKQSETAVALEEVLALAAAARGERRQSSRIRTEGIALWGTLPEVHIENVDGAIRSCDLVLSERTLDHFDVCGSSPGSLCQGCSAEKSVETERASSIDCAIESIRARTGPPSTMAGTLQHHSLTALQADPGVALLSVEFNSRSTPRGSKGRLPSVPPSSQLPHCSWTTTPRLGTSRSRGGPKHGRPGLGRFGQDPGTTIAERHACPPHWYRCDRPFYGSLK